ncbi:MAG: tryptophan synthase subunit alpha [Halanaerobiales bacterium]
MDKIAEIKNKDNTPGDKAEKNGRDRILRETDNSTGNRIENVFKNNKALMPYITAGDPDLDTTREIMLTLDRSGADIIEVGIPFSDPLADGPVIQAAGQRALKADVDLGKIINMLRGIRDEIKTPYLLMGYINPILSYGKDRFIEDALEAGVSGVIIPDLPYDQDIDFIKQLIDNDLSPVLMVTPVTSEERLKIIAKLSRAFIYCVSLLGITGSRQGPIKSIESYLKKVRNYTDLPLALGFGIDGPEKVKKILNTVDGVIIGTALVKIVEKYGEDKEKLLEEVSEFISGIKEVM